MTGVIKVNELQGRSTVDNITVTDGSATMQLQQGLAKAWLMYDNYNGINLARASLNISSVTDDATGVWTNSFTNNMNDTYYCNSGTSDGGATTQSVVCSAYNAYNTSLNYRSSSSNRCGIRNINDNALLDRSFNTMSYLGDLA
jgi:hypothetical protein